MKSHSVRNIGRSKVGAAMAVMAAALVAGGCGGSDTSAAENAGDRSPSTPTSTQQAVEGATNISIESPAADLRVTLDRLLAEHAALAAFTMQKGYDGSKDFKAAAAALDRNTDDLGDAIGSVYGDEAQESFEQQWREHIGFFVDYTVATAQKDKEGRKQALAQLAGYKQSFSEFLAGATGLPQEALADALQSHVDQLTKALDTYAAGNYRKAYAQEHQAYHHMFGTGDTLAAAIVEQQPDKFSSGDTTESAVDLRVTLDRLLAEHALLAAFTMQKGHDGGKDFEAAAAQLDRNTDDLGAAIGSVYGMEAQESFEQQWREHIGFFVDYTVATAKKDKAGRKQALAQLAGYKESFSKFMSEATGLPQDALAEALQSHVDQLTTALDTYAAGDYEKAYTQVRGAYEHMFHTGDTLAGGIVAQSPDKFQA